MPSNCHIWSHHQSSMLSITHSSVRLLHRVSEKKNGGLSIKDKLIWIQVYVFWGFLPWFFKSYQVSLMVMTSHATMNAILKGCSKRAQLILLPLRRRGSEAATFSFWTWLVFISIFVPDFIKIRDQDTKRPFIKINI